MKKQAAPEIKPHLDPQNCRWDLPPIRPKGTGYEFWGGALAIDQALQVHDCGRELTLDGRQRNTVSATVNEIPQTQRRVIADYMIALWTAFKEYPDG